MSKRNLVNYLQKGNINQDQFQPQVFRYNLSLANELKQVQEAKK